MSACCWADDSIGVTLSVPSPARRTEKLPLALDLGERGAHALLLRRRVGAQPEQCALELPRREPLRQRLERGALLDPSGVLGERIGARLAAPDGVLPI